MKRKNLLAGIFAVALTMGTLAGCGSNTTNSVDIESEAEQNTQIEQDTPLAQSVEIEQETATEKETKSEQFVMEYPQHMKDEGFSESVVLEEYPDTIVTLSTYPVLALLEMDVELAAAPSTKVIEYPEDFQGVILPGMMSEQFDIEQVVALEPDLVIVPSSVKDTYGETFETLDIPVYYVAMTSSTTDVYTLIKEQTQSLVDAFSIDDETAKKGEAVMAKFDGTEEKFAAISEKVAGKTVFAITVSSEDAIYLNTETSTLGCMLKLCGLENVIKVDASTGHSMAQLDLETAIEYNPDMIFITGSGTLEENKALMESIYKSNPEYWDAIEAYKNGDVFYLSSSYVSTAGINIIDNIAALVEMLDEKY